ncbi:MAG: hypothetical protein L6Q95_13055 [Planctomycetes bacterium]|nr:hypothetical protein [Planctomycetota bacterium]
MAKVAGLALFLSAVSLGAAVVALARRPPEPPRAPSRADRDGALAAEVAELRREVEVLKAGRPPERAGGDVPAPPLLPQRASVGGGDDLHAIVDDAVAKRTERVLDEMRAKADRKPAMDVFASTLELSEEQRFSTARVVAEGQREVHAILATPAADGTNLLDQLVEMAAKGLAEPGKDPGWGPWFARVLTEKVPGTDETYGARIEAVKKGMRATFQREWSKAQYEEFEAWGVDPTEIESVPGSPNEALWKRVAERARQLGAALPSD